MHPILVEFGPLTIYSYGVCIALAFLVAIATAAARAMRYGWRAQTVYDTCLYAMLASLVGSRLLYVLENPREFAYAPWEALMVWKGGLSYFGGVIAAVIAGAVYLRIQRLSVAEGFDLLIPSVALGHAIGRIGCFFNGCCFGRVCAPPLAVVFPAGSLACSYQLYELGILAPGSAYSLPVYPTQLYEALLELGIFVALSLFLPRKKFNGQVFLLYFVLYGAGRFLMEFLRADSPAVAFLGRTAMNVPQLMSLAALVVSAAVLVWAGAQQRKRGARCSPASTHRKGNT
jgi:phosphatidylglycerol---prolipoprotein diacylglyceryl transferase